jgi:dihydroxyacetone kinase-like protein
MELKKIIEACTQTLIDHVEELTELDAAIGDGDHGLNMRRGALAIQAKLPEWQALPFNDVLKAMGMTCMSTIGGSSGPVFGTLMVTLSGVTSPRSTNPPGIDHRPRPGSCPRRASHTRPSASRARAQPTGLGLKKTA